MKKKLLLGFMLLLFAFIMSPVQAEYSAYDAGIAIEQADIDVVINDAIQPAIIISDLLVDNQVATPLKFPISANYKANKEFTKTHLWNNQLTNQIYYQYEYMGLFRLDIGEFPAICNSIPAHYSISTGVRYYTESDLYCRIGH